MVSPNISEQLLILPRNCGIYLFKNSDSTVLYVGKAINIYNRVTSYFTSSTIQSIKIQHLVEQVKTIDFIITGSEEQALILECNLIKRYRPKYNVYLRDDKTYPYLKIDIENNWPRVFITRRLIKDGSRYFGPFSDASSIKQVLRLTEKIFKIKSCKKFRNKTKQPCLNYHIGRCLAPCTGAISSEDYRRIIKQIIFFLEGRDRKVLIDLRRQMQYHSEKMLYEKAMTFRDQINAIQNTIAEQKINLNARGDKDVIAIAQQNDISCAYLLMIRNNKLIGHNNFYIEGTTNENLSLILTNFVKQYYLLATNIPSEIILPYKLDDSSIITALLNRISGKSITITVPQRGQKRDLVDLAAKNAIHHIELTGITSKSHKEILSTLQNLQNLLNLNQIPQRIEGYDISNIQGNFATGSMVVFEGGKPNRQQYRRFRIKSINYSDDYEMLRELLKRRFSKYLTDVTGWNIKPDLILIDGGKGHLNVALELLKTMKIDDIAAISIAKEKEEIFSSQYHKSIIIDPSSSLLHLLQQIRDEAHRFAITYHRKIRGDVTFSSKLNEISGIGPKRKKALLSVFGSINGIRTARISDLIKIPGITKNLAFLIKENLANNT